MKLKQEFSRLLPYYSQKDNNDKSIKCEEIAEKFAIDFLYWYEKNMTKDKSKELLQMYKKEIYENKSNKAV